MKKCTFLIAIALGLSVAALAQPHPPEMPPAPKIPGLTVPDAFPNGCVDCHVQRPDMDVRLSTLMAQWTKGVRPELMEKAHAAAPAGMVLNGKHPVVSGALAGIPSQCLTCHAAGSKKAPEFRRLMHLIHLTGGEKNHYVTLFQAGCTHCHKLDAATGAWKIASGAEKPVTAASREVRGR